MHLLLATLSSKTREIANWHRRYFFGKKGNFSSTYLAFGPRTFLGVNWWVVWCQKKSVFTSCKFWMQISSCHWQQNFAMKRPCKFFSVCSFNNCNSCKWPWRKQKVVSTVFGISRLYIVSNVTKRGKKVKIWYFYQWRSQLERYRVLLC